MSGTVLSSSRRNYRGNTIDNMCVVVKISWVCCWGVGLPVYCFAKQLYLKYSEANACLQTPPPQWAPECFPLHFWLQKLGVLNSQFMFSRSILVNQFIYCSHQVFDLELIKNIVCFRVIQSSFVKFIHFYFSCYQGLALCILWETSWS